MTAPPLRLVKLPLFHLRERLSLKDTSIFFKEVPTGSKDATTKVLSAALTHIYGHAAAYGKPIGGFILRDRNRCAFTLSQGSGIGCEPEVAPAKNWTGQLNPRSASKVIRLLRTRYT